MLSKLKNITQYQWGMGLSLLSLAFGVAREFVILALLGFSTKNDQLQIYLSIFYSVSLSNDAIRLGVLNLCNYLCLWRILFAASMVGLPYAIIIGLVFYFTTGGLALHLLIPAVFGSFLNLIMILLVTYKQRHGKFLSSLLVNVSPNLLLIPGIILIYLLAPKQGVEYIVYLYALLPVMQITCLLLIKEDATNKEINAESLVHFSVFAGAIVFLKQGIATVGEQFFQTILRSYFFRYGTGYLSLLSIFMRTYLAARFIFIDTYIGAKVKSWNGVKKDFNTFADRLLGKSSISLVIVLLTLAACYLPKVDLWYFAIQLSILFFFSFYFDTLLRIVYFKINSYQHDSALIIGMGIFDGVFSVLAFMLSQFTFFSMVLLIWFWYIARLCLKMLYYKRACLLK